MKFTKTHEEKLEENYVELHYRMMDEEFRYVEEMFTNRIMLVGKRKKFRVSFLPQISTIWKWLTDIYMHIWSKRCGS